MESSVLELGLRLGRRVHVRVLVRANTIEAAPAQSWQQLDVALGLAVCRNTGTTTALQHTGWCLSPWLCALLFASPRSSTPTTVDVLLFAVAPRVTLAWRPGKHSPNCDRNPIIGYDMIQLHGMISWTNIDSIKHMNVNAKRNQCERHLELSLRLLGCLTTRRARW